MKMSIAPRFKIEITKQLDYPERQVFLSPGKVLDGLSLHNKPLDGLRYYYAGGNVNYVLIPFDSFKLIKRY